MKISVKKRENVFVHIKEGMMNCQFDGISNNCVERGGSTRKFVFARFRGGICGIARLIKLKRSCFSVIFRTMVTRTSALRAFAFIRQISWQTVDSWWQIARLEYYPRSYCLFTHLKNQKWARWSYDSLRKAPNYCAVITNIASVLFCLEKQRMAKLCWLFAQSALR